MAVILAAAVCTGTGDEVDEASGDRRDSVPSFSVREMWCSSPEVLLSWVRDLAIDSEGRVYLSDQTAGILLLDSRAVSCVTSGEAPSMRSARSG